MSPPPQDPELRAIEALHEKDRAAVLAGDAEKIMSLWTDDIVTVRSDGSVSRGRVENEAVLRSNLELGAAFVPLEYALELEEVKVLGDYAYEWGFFRSAMMPSQSGQVLESRGKLMRILRKQPDGSWRIHRTINTSDS